ncbi:MAG: Trm112 family protein [Desulfuromonas sp.]|nr:Trm112 family protein [Desulfuromonas sp.]
MPLAQQLIDVLVCPKCKGKLEVLPEDVLRCNQCQLDYPVRDGVPIMLIDEAVPVQG